MGTEGTLATKGGFVEVPRPASATVPAHAVRPHFFSPSPICHPEAQGQMQSNGNVRRGPRDLRIGREVRSLS